MSLVHAAAGNKEEKNSRIILPIVEVWRHLQITWSWLTVQGNLWPFPSSVISLNVLLYIHRWKMGKQSSCAHAYQEILWWIEKVPTFRGSSGPRLEHPSWWGAANRQARLRCIQGPSACPASTTPCTSSSSLYWIEDWRWPEFCYLAETAVGARPGFGLGTCPGGWTIFSRKLC